MRIPHEEIRFHPSSTGSDPHGRLFEWRGMLCRGIDASHTATCTALLASPSIARCEARGYIIHTEATPYTSDDFPLVLQHPRLPFVSYPFEWCAPMLKDAALRLLDLNTELAGDGYLTKDPSMWNMLFDGVNPLYVDFAGIWPLENMRYAFSEWPGWFARFSLYPLRLMAADHGRIVRRLLQDYERGIEQQDFLKFGCHPILLVKRFRRRAAVSVRSRAKRALPALIHRKPDPQRDARLPRAAGAGTDRRLWFQLLDRLREEVAAVQVVTPTTKWSRYYERSLSPAAPIEGLSDKHKNVEAVLDRLRPRSVVDIGSSTGWFSRLAAKKGAHVAVIDADESAVSMLYRETRDTGLPIVPLVIDMRNPSPTYGLCNTRVLSASDRLNGELTLALAVTHHLVIGQHMDFLQVIESLALFARRWLLVEFISEHDTSLRATYPDGIPPWYTRDRFTAALERRFCIREVLPSHPQTRTLLLCERR